MVADVSYRVSCAFVTVSASQPFPDTFKEMQQVAIVQLLFRAIIGFS